MLLPLHSPRYSCASLQRQACWLLVLASPAAAQIPAFPGAQGFGGYATGGRGGDVYHVTNLNTTGAGSFAEGLATVPAAGRTIVFDVSGHIHVNKTTLAKSKVTIAGQTAPGDGIGFKDGTFIISGDDVVIRHVRFRYGKKDAGGDCIDLSSGTLNAVLDHVSIQFSTDENISSFNSPPENLTMQWALNGWGLESHSCGGLWDQNHATCHHSLWAHNHTRNAKARPGGLLDWVNNVTFDWGIGFIMGDSATPAAWKANVRNCYYLCPPGNIRTKALEKANLDRNGAANFSLYLNNCRHDSNANGLLDGTDKGYGIASGSYITLAAPVAAGGVPVAMDDPAVAFKKIASAAGALRLDVSYAGALRDEVDAKMIANLVTQTAQHISSETQTGAGNGGFGTLNSTAAPTDTDKDGMPDFYEQALGWNAAVQDHNTALASSGGVLSGTTFMPAGTVAGYTRLEEYLHFLAIPHGTVARNAGIAVNMAKFTGGFSSSPAFTVLPADVSNGSVVLSGAGNSIATFTPALNYTGRARFEFKVTDSAGHEWTQTCALVVTNSGLPRNLIWKGGLNANAWELVTPNWTFNGAATAFSSGDNVRLDDTGSLSPAVNVSGTGNTPSSVTVDAAGSYTFSGTGSIASTGALTKRGAGALTLANSVNSFASAVLDEGTLSLPTGFTNAPAMALNGGTLTFAANLDEALTVNGAVAITPSGQRELSGALTGTGTASLNIGNNTFSLTGNTGAFAGTFALGASTGYLRFYGALGSAAATFDLGTGTADLINRNGNVTIALGSLTGGAGTTLSGASAAANPTTYEIGANGASTSFAGAITNNVGTTAITKLGAGALTLTGTTGYTGATTVSAGDLIANGTLGSSAITVAGGAKLRGAGSIAGAVAMQAGAQLSPGAASGLAGTLTLGSAGLSLANMTLSMQLSSSPAGANDRVVMTGGPLTMTGALNFAFSLPDGVLGAGEYFLVSGAATGSASSVTFTHNLINTPRQTFTIPPAGTDPFIKLIVAGNPATLVWKGNVSATWDTAATANWLNGAAGDVFQPGDAVVFDDTSTVNSVSIAATAAPRSLAFTNAVRAITLGGTDPSVAAVTGGALTKTGAGALTLTGTNDFASVTIGPGATMTLANDYANRGALGGGPVTFNGGTLTMHDDVNFSTTGSDDSTWALVIPAGQSGRLHADSRCNLYGTLSGGGTFNFRAPFARTTLLGDWSAFSGTINVLTDADGGDFRIGTSYAPAGYAQATINLSAGVWLYYIGTSASGTGTTIAIGELSGPSGTHLRGGVTGGRNFIYRIGEKTPAGGEVVFAGDIAEQNTGTTTSYVKTGAGVWRLSGSGAWNGGTVVEQGTLRLWPSNAAGFTCAGATDVLAGAALGLGTGRFETDALNIAAGAVLTVEDDFNLAGDFNNDGTATILTGHFTVSGDMVNNGTLRMQGLSTLAASGEFTNNGLLDLLTSSASLPVNFTNNGTVILNTERRIRSAAKSGAIFTFTVQGYAGHTFQLQRAGALAGPWVNTGAAQAGSASILSLTDAGGAAGGRGFYRVVVTP